MTPTPSPLAGVVVCGGSSRRFGSDKRRLDWEGEPLLARVVGRLALVAHPVVLASGQAGDLSGVGLPPEVLEVADEMPGSGPLGGVVAGLEACPSGLAAVVAGDMPFVSGAVLLRLAADLEAAPDAVAAVPTSPTGPDVLHAVYRTMAAEPLRRSIVAGRLSVRAALAALPVLAVDVEWPDGAGPHFATNVNRPTDVAAAGQGGLRRRRAQQ